MSTYKGGALHVTPQAGSFVYQESFSAPPQKVVVDSVNAPGRVQGEMVQFPNFSVPQMAFNQIYSSANVGYSRPLVNGSVVVDNGNTIVYVADLNWWTTDADLENVLSCYGRVKEIKFFDERVSGKSKGYCEVEFYESAAAAACKLGMDGHPFNGRPCVVSFANPQSVKHTSSSHMNKTHVQAPPQAQCRKPGIDTAVGSTGNGPNYPTGDAGRNLGRGGHVMLNKGPVGGPASGRGLMKPSNGGVTSGAPYGQGFGGLIHPQTMMAPGIVPAYMGRGTGYGSFTGPLFPGMMAPFPAVNPMGVVLPGTVPFVPPPFLARGMPSNVMMRTAGNEGPHPFMWTDTSVVGLESEEHDQRTRESSYVGGDDNASEYGYGQSKEVKTGSVSRAKEWGIENADEREPDWERHDGGYRNREENDSYHANQQKERDSGYRNDFDREQDYHKSQSSYPDSAKRRRPSE